MPPHLRFGTHVTVPPPKLIKPPPTPSDPAVDSCVSRYAADGWTNLGACIRNEVKSISLPTPNHVVGASGGTQPPNPCPVQKLTQVYVSNSVGLDSNSCVDAGHPCKTPQQIQSRYGCGAGPVDNPWATVDIHWHFMDPMPESTMFSMNPQIAGSGGSFDIQCATTVGAAGVMTIIHPKNNLGSQFLVVDLGPVGAGAFDKIVNSTHPSSGWVDQNIPNVDGGPSTTFQITQPLDTSDNEVVWANGDAFTVQTPNPLYWLSYAPTCGSQNGQIYFPSNCSQHATMENCRQIAVHPGGPEFESVNLYHVVTHGLRLDGQADFQSAALFNAAVTQSPHNFRDSIAYAGSYSNLFVTGSDDPFGFYLDGDVILHGTTVFPPGSVGGNGATWGDPGGHWFVNGGVYPGHIFPGSTLPLMVSAAEPTGGPLIISSEFYGAWNYCGAAPFLLAAQCFGANIQLVTDLGSAAWAIDYAHDGAPDRIQPLGVPALMDGPPFFGVALNAQKWGGFYNNSFSPPARTPYVAAALNGGTGTSVLGYGTAILTGTTPITIAFPTLDASSRIIISRKTPTGTLGNISAPAAGRIVSTSFTVVSDAAETSTVDWLVIN